MRATVPCSARCVAMVGLALVLVVAAGCERGMHDMYDQPRYDTDAPSELLPGDTSAQPPPAHTVLAAAGGIADATGGRQGLAAEDPDARPPLTTGLMAEGQQRFGIFCSPCHGALGDGRGEVVRRGFPQPPDFHSERLRGTSDGHIFDVISNGYGVMYSYGNRLDPRQRWAVVAYIRALQRSQHTEVSALTAEQRRYLGAAP